MQALYNKLPESKQKELNNKYIQDLRNSGIEITNQDIEWGLNEINCTYTKIRFNRFVLPLNDQAASEDYNSILSFIFKYLLKIYNLTIEELM